MRTFATTLTGLIFLALNASAQTQFMLDMETLKKPSPAPPARPAPAPAPLAQRAPAPRPQPQVPPLPEQKPKPKPQPVLPPANPAPDAATEADTRKGPCPACTQMEKNLRDLQAVVKGQLRMNDLTSWNRNRGLVQLPTRGERGNIGPCGSFHYNPDRNKKTGELMDNYANPLTACVFMSLLQDWKKRCPDSQKGCRVAWGDISHKTALRFNGHSSHTHGNCIDIRPMRKGGFDNAPLVYQNSDRETTAAFIQMAKEKGASPVYYNDPKGGGSYSSGHHNHMHICFHSNKKTRDVCANYKYDAAVCGPN